MEVVIQNRRPFINIGRPLKGSPRRSTCSRLSATIQSMRNTCKKEDGPEEEKQNRNHWLKAPAYQTYQIRAAACLRVSIALGHKICTASIDYYALDLFDFLCRLPVPWLDYTQPEMSA